MYYLCLLTYFEALSLLELPPEIIEEILLYVSTQTLPLVCKQFRAIIYKNKKSFTLCSSMIYNVLSLLPNLQYLTIVGDNKAEGVMQLSTTELLHLKRITFKKFIFGDMLHFRNLVSAISHLKIAELQIVNCVNVKLDDLKCVLETMPTLKACDMRVRLESSEEIEDFANLANRLAGYVNLNLENLYRIPSKLLMYPWRAYRVMFPCSQINRPM